jgi:hypothetical protein
MQQVFDFLGARGPQVCRVSGEGSRVDRTSQLRFVTLALLNEIDARSPVANNSVVDNTHHQRRRDICRAIRNLACKMY